MRCGWRCAGAGAAATGGGGGACRGGEPTRGGTLMGGTCRLVVCSVYSE